MECPSFEEPYIGSNHHLAESWNASVSSQLRTYEGKVQEKWDESSGVQSGEINRRCPPISTKPLLVFRSIVHVQQQQKQSPACKLGKHVDVVKLRVNTRLVTWSPQIHTDDHRLNYWVKLWSVLDTGTHRLVIVCHTVRLDNTITTVVAQPKLRSHREHSDNKSL